MTKCVTTAVMRNSASSRRSRDTVSSMTAFSRLGSKLRDLAHQRKRSHSVAHCAAVRPASRTEWIAIANASIARARETLVWLQVSDLHGRRGDRFGHSSQALAHKNKLAAADAKVVEEAFEQKLSGLSPSPAETGGAPTVDPAAAAGAGTAPPQSVTDHTAGPDPHLPKSKIDKSVLTIGMPRRYRNKEHLRFVARQPCLLCGRKPSDPHHLRYVQCAWPQGKRRVRRPALPGSPSGSSSGKGRESLVATSPYRAPEGGPQALEGNPRGGGPHRARGTQAI